ncbi:MAG TPA: c-type cytochrome [Burkholderiales bacterium]|nr:c-type cytochrome [Burkholderiales bacterium]
MSDEHSSIIKTPKQLIAVVLAAFLVPVFTLIFISQLVVGSFGDVSKNDPAMSPEAVAKRLKPVGEVVVADTAVGATNQSEIRFKEPVQPVPVAANVVAVNGKAVFETNCAVCHVPGAANAPKFGDKAAWAPRIKTGIGSLYRSALNGKNVMPPKGGNAALTDAEVKAAVDYIVSQSK